ATRPAATARTPGRWSGSHTWRSCSRRRRSSRSPGTGLVLWDPFGGPALDGSAVRATGLDSAASGDAKKRRGCRIHLTGSRGLAWPTRRCHAQPHASAHRIPVGEPFPLPPRWIPPRADPRAPTGPACAENGHATIAIAPQSRLPTARPRRGVSVKRYSLTHLSNPVLSRGLDAMASQDR